MKISGINVQKKVIIDEWTEWDPAKKEPAKKYYEYNVPPLALVIAMQESGKEGYEIAQTLVGLGNRPHIKADQAVEATHHETANKIYKHFAHKYTMRRLNGERMSEFMNAVDELCENKKKICEDSVAPLISLPRLYKTDKHLESILSGHNSAKHIKNLSFASYSGEVEFVDKIRLKNRRSDTIHYYFKTQKNYLFRVVVDRNGYGECAWDALSLAGKIFIDTPAIYTYTVTGHKFNVLQSSTDMEIKII